MTKSLKCIIIVSNDTLLEGEELKDVHAFLMNTFLFRGISTTEAERLIQIVDVEVSEFERGATIYSPSRFEKKIGFVISGECSVVQKHASSRVSLKPILPGDTFGILTVFSDADEYPTYIIAKRHSKVLFLTDKNVQKLVELSPTISLNIITFMSERISFLNKRIDTYSSTTVEQKLASYILTLSKGGELTRLSLNKAEAAQAISAGRASLYRALHALCDAGAIALEEKNLIILNAEKLERITK